MNVKISYEKKPYFSTSFYLTKMRRQREILKLLGFEIYEKDDVRVLEIGCSYGGNIIGDALYYPKAEFIGIDLSSNQIEDGKKIIEEIGLENIKLYQMDILDYNLEFGKFDYIICHGVFSWVKDEVKQKILDVIKKSLKDNGSAVISYNVYPAFKNIDILKDIMKFRLKMLKNNNEESLEENELGYAKGALEFIVDFTTDNEILKNDAKFFLSKDDYYLYHEFLEENNTPIYLYHFEEMLNKYGLTHITDSNLSRSNKIIDEKLSEELELESNGSNLIKEQFYDFMYNNTFRYSIISHIGRHYSANGFIENLRDFHLSGNYKYQESTEDYVYRDVILKKEFNDIIEEFNKFYPNSIKLDYLIEKFGDEAINKVTAMIVDNVLEFSLEKTEVDENIQIKEINEKYAKYIEVSLKNIDKIGASNKKGDIYNKDTLFLIDMFIKSKNIDEFKESIKNLGVSSEKEEEILRNILLEISLNGQVI